MTGKQITLAFLVDEVPDFDQIKGIVVKHKDKQIGRTSNLRISDDRVYADLSLYSKIDADEVIGAFDEGQGISITFRLRES